MNYPLYRYWIPPSRWRQWSVARRLTVIIVALAASFSLACIPLCVWLPQHAWSGWSGYFVPQFGMIFLAIVDVGAAVAGATVIASERERGTWEPLLLTSLGVSRLVRVKFAARLVLCMLVVGLALPFWLGWAYEVLVDNDRDVNAYYTANGTLPHFHVALRLSLFLMWLAIRIVGRTVPFTAFGLAVSARCKRVRTAILIAISSLIGVCVVLWHCLPNGAWGSHLYMNPIGAVAASLLVWPISPNSYDGYSATGLLPGEWRMDLYADLLWLLAIPAFWLWMAIRWSRTPNPYTRTADE